MHFVFRDLQCKQVRTSAKLGGFSMKPANWKKGLFFLTIVSSILSGFWGITKSYLYMEFLKLMSYRKMDVMPLNAPRPLGMELYIAAEFLITFAVPFGLTWLIYFVITRVVFPKSRIRIDKTRNGNFSLEN